MLFNKIEAAIDFAIAAVDGVYGWQTETISLIIIIVLFNFVFKWVLRRLHLRFAREKKIWHDSFVRALYKPLSYYVWFFAIVHILDLIAYRVIDEATIENMHTLLAIGAIFAISWFMMRWKNNVVQFMIMKSKNHEIAIDLTRIDVINKVVSIVIGFFTILLLLEVTNSSVNTIIAFGGVGGLTVAFASQEIVANFFAGLMIYATHPFAKGDWIQIPEKSIEGIVDEIGWYMTRLRSLDKKPVYVPNTTFSKIVVINPSRMSHRQFKEILGIRYCDFSKLRGIMEEIKAYLQSHPDIDRNQSIMVFLKGYGSYSIDILIQAHSQLIDTESFYRLKDQLLYRIGEIVEQQGAEMAFPTTTLAIPDPVALVKKE